MSAEAGSPPGEPGRVWFATGAPVSRRNEAAEINEYEEHLRTVSAAFREDHPANALIEYILEQPSKRVGEIVKGNFPFVQDAISRMPDATPRERDRRLWCDSLLISLKQHSKTYYRGSDHTARIFAIGPNFHQLPRELRKIAFGGCVEFDLRAAQLAVVARLWNIPLLYQFLTEQKSVWGHLADLVGLPLTECKPILKRTVYSVVFGMQRSNLLRQLASGTQQDAGIGDDRADVIIQSRMIRKLLSARNRQQKQVYHDGGARDAFGKEIILTGNYGQPSREARSILSEVVQSWEMQLMLPILEVVGREKQQIYLVSWLHDGVTLCFGNAWKQERQTRQICEAVKAAAVAADMPTYLEVEPLPQLAQVRRENSARRGVVGASPSHSHSEGGGRLASRSC